MQDGRCGVRRKPWMHPSEGTRHMQASAGERGGGRPPVYKLVFCRALHPDAMAPLQARRDVEVTVLTPDFRGPPMQAELAAHIGDAHGIMVGLERVSEALLATAPKLRVISRFGVGFDTLD